MKEMSRRTFLRCVAGVAVDLGVFFALGCAKKPILTVTPGLVDKAKISSEEWQVLSAKDRINFIQKSIYPEGIKEFDPIDEITKATAEFFHEQIGGQISAEQLLSKIKFLGPDDFVRRTEEETERKATPSEAEMRREGTIEIVSKKTNEIIFNTKAYGNYVNIYVQALGKQTEGWNLEAIARKSILCHAFSHVVSTREILNFDPITINETGKPSDEIIFDHMEGFTMVGKQNGNPYYLTATEEAMVELLGSRIAERTGYYFPASDNYAAGANLVQNMNDNLGVNAGFIDYATGKKSLVGILETWGKYKKPADKEAALQSLIIVGWLTKGLIDGITAERRVVQLLVKK